MTVGTLVEAKIASSGSGVSSDDGVTWRLRLDAGATVSDSSVVLREDPEEPFAPDLLEVYELISAAFRLEYRVERLDVLISSFSRCPAPDKVS